MTQKQNDNSAPTWRGAGAQGTREQLLDILRKKAVRFQLEKERERGGRRRERREHQLEKRKDKKEKVTQNKTKKSFRNGHLIVLLV